MYFVSNANDSLPHYILQLLATGNMTVFMCLEFQDVVDLIYTD